MEQLILAYSDGGYELLISDIEGPQSVIQFIANADDEAAGVKLLAESMQNGVEDIVANADYIFQDSQTVNESWFEAVFSSTDSLVFAGEEIFGIYSAEEGESLLDVLPEAGEALFDFALSL